MPKYAEISPTELLRLWEANAPALVPWGALEWHGEHLPLGLDGIVAEAFANRLAEQVGGVALPGIWLPITTLPHASSLQVRTGTLRAILDDLIGGLAESGARTIVLLTGHYAQAHLIELFEAALRGMDDYESLRVFAGTPLQPLGRAELLDHAARYETSQLLAIRPDLVAADRLGEEVHPHRDGVLGEHPALGSVEEGEALLAEGIRMWADWIATAGRLELGDFYKRGFDELDEYVTTFYEGSWEEALIKWWQTKA